jgi:hypothetical protein
MAVQKRSPSVGSTTQVIAAFRNGTQAAGAGRVRPGFAFTATRDLQFALGWPHVASVVEGHPVDGVDHAVTIEGVIRVGVQRREALN